jgi:alpha-mannosidase
MSFLAPAAAIEAIAEREPERITELREAITDGRADVVGGTYGEVDEPLLPLESILWQFRKGGEVYRHYLDDRNVETLATRRFALYPQRPQVARRWAFRFGLHLGFDAGIFPVRVDSKRLWESPDGSSLEALIRPPIGADRPAPGLTVAWRLARTMKDDHVATLPLVHWPSTLAGWYTDWRRSASYSPVLARWVTLGDYFHLTDRPFESFRPGIDDYVTPYLAQAAARGAGSPIAHRSAQLRLRARLEGVGWLRTMALALGGNSPKPEAGEAQPLQALEADLEAGRLEAVATSLDSAESTWGNALARVVSGTEGSGQTGYHVFNPLSIPRRVPVRLPDAAADLRPEGPLRASQFTDEGVWAVVDLPAFGYAWVPAETKPDAAPAPLGAVSAKGHTLRNDAIEVEVDATTGGLRSIRSTTESTARLGQQLTMTGLVGPDGVPATSRMRLEHFEVDYGGPALVQATTRGTLRDPQDDRPLARFHQRYRLWTGRPILEIDIALSDLDAAWTDHAAVADPWSHALSCRWAWPDPSSMLRRTILLSPEVTEAERPETPDVVDISTRRQRTALLFGGLAHHRRHGPRMLDTLLIAGRETERTFRLGVVLDFEYPFQAALDFVGPLHVVPTGSGPPRTGPAGWFFHLDNKAVALMHLEWVDQTGEGRGWGVVCTLLETSGAASRCRLRAFRSPTWARQIDFHGDLIIDLQVEDDAVLIDLTPHELARVDITLG